MSASFQHPVLSLERVPFIWIHVIRIFGTDWIFLVFVHGVPHPLLKGDHGGCRKGNEYYDYVLFFYMHLTVFDDTHLSKMGAL